MRTIMVISTRQFSDNIRRIRKDLGWSREEFCRHFDMELWMLEGIEEGDYRKGFDIYLDSCAAIRKFTGMTDEELVYGDMPPEERNMIYE